jgi:hypothetical protein
MTKFKQKQQCGCVKIAIFTLPLDFMLGGNKIKYQLGYFKVDPYAK